MSRSVKTAGSDRPEAFDFSLATKRQHEAQRKELVLTDSKNLHYQFQRLEELIKWEALHNSGTEDAVNEALSAIAPSDRGVLPNAAAILATVQDPHYPKLRPISFLAKSCALAMRTNPKSADLYSPRYSRDICYRERKRQDPPPKQPTNLEYWQHQADLGCKVPRKYLRQINQRQANEKRINEDGQKGTILTYNDIREAAAVRKRRTTVWLSEATVAQLKKRSAATGAPMAELFRRAVEAYLKGS